MSSKGALNTLLRSQFPTLNPLTPFQNNVAAVLTTIIYVKLVVEIGSILRKYANPEISRKFIHLCACSLVVFWPLFDDDHWGWRLNVVVPVVMTLKLFYKGAILKDPEDEDVQSMSRSSSPSELLYGPLQMTLVMSYVGLTKFNTPDEASIVMASFVGDAMGALIGTNYGRYTYQLPFGGTKSIEGNIACILGTMAGIAFYFYVLGIEMMKWKLTMGYAVVSAMAEATAVKDWDNVVIFVVMNVMVRHLSENI